MCVLPGTNPHRLAPTQQCSGHRILHLALSIFPVRTAEECFQKLLEDLTDQGFEEEDLPGTSKWILGIRAKKRGEVLQEQRECGCSRTPRRTPWATISPTAQAASPEGLLEPSDGTSSGLVTQLHLVSRSPPFHSMPLAHKLN